MPNPMKETIKIKVEDDNGQPVAKVEITEDFTEEEKEKGTSKEKVKKEIIAFLLQKGFVIKVGPGYPLPMPADEDDLWKGKDDQIKYLPLQAQEGDLAIFLQRGAIEVMYESEKYFIVPQASILMLEREEDL